MECRNLRRVYTVQQGGTRREHVALEGLDLEVQRGRVFGLLGPNGAGKTTTMRILSTLLLPTDGVARVAGFDVVQQAVEVRRRIGVAVGGERGFFPRLTGRENLRYYAALAGLPPSAGRVRAGEALALVRLDAQADRRVETYSRGMKQRLHIARAVLADPEVLFLDEPTIGLDPEIAQEFRALVPEFARAGKTVLLTTHHMREAELCDELSIIDRGRLVVAGTPGEIRRGFGQSRVFSATLRRRDPALVAQLHALAGVTRVEVEPEDSFHRLKVHFQPGAAVPEQIEAAAGRDNADEVVVRDPTLEEAYLTIVAKHRKHEPA